MDEREFDYPISNDIYNLLAVLTSKLEAVEAYAIYEEDMEGAEAELLRRIDDDDRKHIELLITAIEGHIRQRGMRPGGSRGPGGGRNGGQGR